MKKNLLLATAALCAALVLPALPTAAQAETSVKVVMHAPLRVLDPIFTNAYVTRNHGYLVFDTLFSLDNEGKPQPQMVDSYKLSADKLTYTFKLRSGLKFHDGSPVTSDDVIASITRWAATRRVGHAPDGHDREDERGRCLHLHAAAQEALRPGAGLARQARLAGALHHAQATGLDLAVNAGDHRNDRLRPVQVRAGRLPARREGDVPEVRRLRAAQRAGQPTSPAARS
jgi:hypothetical protein